LLLTASPFSLTAHVLEVVAPLSVPMKIISLISGGKLEDPGGKGKYYWPETRLADRMP
jgi:hypothetical protein